MILKINGQTISGVNGAPRSDFFPIFLTEGDCEVGKVIGRERVEGGGDAPVAGHRGQFIISSSNGLAVVARPSGWPYL